MVAHDFTDTSFLLPIRTCRRMFFEENSSVMLFMMLLSAAPIDEFKVEPCLVVAALIGWAQAWSFVWDGESTMQSYLPIPI